MATHCEAIAQGGGLGVGAMVDRSCETAGEAGWCLPRFDGSDGFLRAQPLV